MERIRDLLQKVYKEEAVDQIISAIPDLLRKYPLVSKPFQLSHKDVALIAYGDQVFEAGKNKLASLQFVLDNYLKNSISILHILPFYPYSSDDGFSVVDYYQVRDDVGTWEDISKLSTSFSLMFDAVVNHMSSQSEWFAAYLNDDERFADYFIDGTHFKHTEHVVRPRTSPLFHDFNGKMVWTTFSRDQVDLNYSNPKVFLQILDILLFYVSKGASLIRLDAVGFMWKKDNSSCIHLEETHTLIKVMREVLEQNSTGVLLITETNVPHEENISYFGEGNEAHLVYNFTLPPLLAFSILQQDTEKLSQWAQSLNLDYNNTCFFNFLASHDGIGLRPVSGILNEDEIKMLTNAATANGGKISYRSDASGSSPYEINCNYFSLLHGSDKDPEKAFQRMILAHAILLTFPGLPAIYFHSIFGLENDLEGLEKLGYNRAINRSKTSYKFLKEQLEESASYPSKVLDAIKGLIDVRKQFEQFNPYASFEFLQLPGPLFGIRRFGPYDDKSSVNCYFNLSEQPIGLKLNKKGFDILTNNVYEAGDITIEPLAYIWLH